jgi:hypothetical protein
MKNAQTPTTTELHQIVIKKRVAVFELLKTTCQHLQMIFNDEPVFEMRKGREASETPVETYQQNRKNRRCTKNNVKRIPGSAEIHGDVKLTSAPKS